MRESRGLLLDGHIRLTGSPADPNVLCASMAKAGVKGGIVISMPPHSVSQDSRDGMNRLDHLLNFCRPHRELYPFYWLDPLDDEAMDQVKKAVEGFAAGFKITCNRCAPFDERLSPVFKTIAWADKPILFDAGVTMDDSPSSRFNRPVDFECMLSFHRLRFSLCHAAWPWVAECLAVYAKFLCASLRPGGPSVEMFMDLSSPAGFTGTELAGELFSKGIDIRSNAVFGTNLAADEYDPKTAISQAEHIRQALEKCGLGTEGSQDIFSGNLMRFLGPPADR